MKKYLLFLLAALAAYNSGASAGSDHSISLEVIGQYHIGIFGESAAEIVSYDPKTKRLFVVNAVEASIDVLDIREPSLPSKIASIDAAKLGAAANSVDVKNGIVAVAIEAVNKQDNGLVAFYNAKTLNLLNTVPVGALPDMLTFTPDGLYVLVANEGEPNADYSVDPEGSVSIIDISKGVKKAKVRTADFRRFNSQKEQLLAQGIRIFGPNATVAQDFEPEYIAAPGCDYAYVTLQENNAIAEIHIASATVKRLLPLGYKDHNLPGNGLDASDRDNGINIASWPVLGMYLPDSIASYSHRGTSYLVTANEGDAREYETFVELERINGITLDPVAFPNASTLRNNAQLGRLRITTTLGDTDNDGAYEKLYAFGARSFSIFDTDGTLVYDSGDEFERITAAALPDFFNSSNDSNDSFDTRSDDKGPEPEGIAVGMIDDRTYAFIGLERSGGIMVYDITNPGNVNFIQYINNRNFSEQACLVLDDGECMPGAGNSNPAAGDLGPEGLKFIPGHDSPTKKPLLVVGNEVSGTTTIFAINQLGNKDGKKK